MPRQKFFYTYTKNVCTKPRHISIEAIATHSFLGQYNGVLLLRFYRFMLL